MLLFPLYVQRVQRLEGASISEAEQQVAGQPHTDDASTAYHLLLASSGGLWWTKGNSWNAAHIPHVATTTIPMWAARHIQQAAHANVGPDYQPNLHTTHTGLAPVPPTPAQLYFSVA